MTFVDTNYFIRFLLKDNENQYTQAKELFYKAAQGQVELITSEVVFFEIYWVFKSFYEKPKSELIDILQNILRMNFIIIPQKDILENCLEIFQKTNIDDLEDCYNVAFAKKRNIKEFKTFDVKLAKFFKSQKD